MTNSASYTDDELLTGLRAGDPGAFRVLYKQYWERLSLYALKVIGEEEEASDIVQEVFVSLWRRREMLEIRGSLTMYLLRSVRNLCLRYIETNIHKRDFLKSLSISLGSMDLSSINSLELQDLEVQLEQAIARLPARMREVFRLSRQENLSYREIAERLSIAENTVKKQVHNALEMIRKELGPLSGTFLLLCCFLQD